MAMRLVMFADAKTNTFGWNTSGWHVFGNADMRDTGHRTIGIIIAAHGLRLVAFQ